MADNIVDLFASLLALLSYTFKLPWVSVLSLWILFFIADYLEYESAGATWKCFCVRHIVTAARS